MKGRAIDSLVNSSSGDKKKALDHVFNTFSEYEFDLFDKNGNKIISKSEYKTVID